MAFCSACGSQLSGNAAFCSKCGTRTASTVAVATVMPPAPDPRTAPAAVQAAVGAAAAMQYQHYAQTTCPRCSHHMIVVFRQPRAGWILVTIGVLLFFIPFLGWVLGPILILIGIVVWITQKGKARYQCPGCNFST